MMKIQFLPKRYSKSSGGSNRKKVMNVIILTIIKIIIVAFIYSVVSYMPELHTFSGMLVATHKIGTAIPLL